MGRATQQWLHEGVSLLHPPELASPQHLGFPRPGLGSAKKSRPAPGRAAESDSQTARRGAAAEELARLPEPDGSQRAVSHAETGEQEQPSRDCKALGPGGWDPFAGSRGCLVQHPHSAGPHLWCEGSPLGQGPRGRPRQGLQHLAAAFPGPCSEFPACARLYLVI